MLRTILQVVTGQEPWAGLNANEMSERVLKGDRPELPTETVATAALEGFEGFADLLKTMWASDPAERPALRDVALKLRVPVVAEPPKVLSSTVAVPAVMDEDRDAVGVGSDAEEVAAAVTEASRVADESLRQAQAADATATGLVPRRVEGDEVGYPLADAATDGRGTPARGGGGETSFTADRDEDSTAATISCARGDEANENLDECEAAEGRDSQPIVSHARSSGMESSSQAPSTSAETVGDSSAIPVPAEGDGGTRAVVSVDAKGNTNAPCDEQEKSFSRQKAEKSDGRLLRHFNIWKIMDRAVTPIPKPTSVVQLAPLGSEQAPESSGNAMANGNPATLSGRDYLASIASPVSDLEPQATLTSREAGAPGKHFPVPETACSGASESEEEEGNLSVNTKELRQRSSPALSDNGNIVATAAGAAAASGEATAERATAASTRKVATKATVDMATVSPDAVVTATAAAAASAATTVAVPEVTESATFAAAAVGASSTHKAIVARTPAPQDITTQAAVSTPGRTRILRLPPRLRAAQSAARTASLADSISQDTVDLPADLTSQPVQRNKGVTASAATAGGGREIQAIPSTPSRWGSGFSTRGQMTPRRARVAFRDMTTSVIRLGKTGGSGKVSAGES